MFFSWFHKFIGLLGWSAFLIVLRVHVICDLITVDDFDSLAEVMFVRFLPVKLISFEGSHYADLI